jgi:hypothetical protein
MSATTPRVLVIGIAGMDIRGRTLDTLVPATSNPEGVLDRQYVGREPEPLK